MSLHTLSCAGELVGQACSGVEGNWRWSGAAAAAAAAATKHDHPGAR